MKPEIVRWVAKEFSCDLCQSRAKPKSSRPAAIPRSYQPGKVVGVDLVFLPDVGGGSTFPALSMLDWGTNFQMVERVESKEPEEVWQTTARTWFRIFGPPEVLVADPGREFLGVFMKNAVGLGIVFYQTASRAPWQQGKTERHGGHYKEMLARSRAELVVTNRAELLALMIEVEQAKNRYLNRSGFSPVQRQIGQWPRLPGSLNSDEGIDPALLEGMVTDDIEQLHQMRRVAQKAFAEVNAKEVLRRAIRGRSRPGQSFSAGDLIFVYRVPMARRRRGGETERFEVASNKPVWVGPGTVLTEDGPNLWVSMMGQLWRVAKEQCRPATSGEKMGVEAVMQECRDLVEEYRKSSHRQGYVDLTQHAMPPEEPEEQRREEEREYTPSVIGEEVAEVDDLDVPEAAPGRQTTEREPESEEMSQATPPQSARAELSRSAGEVDAGVGQPDFEEMWRQYRERSDRLDGTTQLRLRGRSNADPYWCRNAITVDADAEVEEEAAEARRAYLQELTLGAQKKDYWQVDWQGRTVTRRHQQRRKARFDPMQIEGFGDVAPMFEVHRSTQFNYLGGHVEPREELDQWQVRELKRRSEGRWWRGSTTFFLRAGLTPAECRAVEAFAAAKKGQDEVKMQHESPADKAEWRQQDKAEWEKVVSQQAEVLSLEESRRVRAQLAAEGKEARILPTKIARRYKPSDQPGEPPTKKSRLCIRGDLDPDALELERFSPTVTTMIFNIMLQVAANYGFDGEVADFKSAFCQSNPLQREAGPLYFQLPMEGIEGINQDILVKVVNGCYGLVDAPLHWRKTLVEEFRQLGHHPSRMDPCTFLAHDPAGRLTGAVAVEVDDLFMVGGDSHKRQMEKLKAKFKFGKWVRLKETEEGCAFNGRRIRQLPSGEFLIDMQKFVQERLYT